VLGFLVDPNAIAPTDVQAAVALKQPLIRELPRAQRGRTLVRTAFKVRFSPKATPGADAALGPSWANRRHRKAGLLPLSVFGALFVSAARIIPGHPGVAAFRKSAKQDAF
jgi:hypothetical protein